jgi:hypothetical protein
MIKCFFVDVTSISSDLPRSSFAESELDRLANSILATDGLLRPLILQEIGVEKYTVIEGHREYYAAVKAKEKNLNKAEMVNAFVIGSNIHRSAIDQLTLLKEPQPSPPMTVVDPAILIERLLPTLLTAISQQIQPIVIQLAEHKQILDLLNSDRHVESKDILPSLIPLEIEISKQPELKEVQTLTTKSTPNGKKVSKPKDVLVPKPDVVKTPKQPESTKVKAVKTTTHAPAKSKKTSNLVGSIDPTKANNTLDLINSLSQEQLIVSMKRSVIPNAEKLATNIITERNTQPAQKFDSWETIAATKIGGLGAATIKKIIEKLK